MGKGSCAERCEVNLVKTRRKIRNRVGLSGVRVQYGQVHEGIVIVATAPAESICTISTDDSIVPVLSTDYVVARASIECVVSIVAFDRIVSRAPINNIIL